MKKWLLLQRILASIIDLIIVYFPIHFLCQVIFEEINSNHLLLSHLVFILYNLLLTVYWKGKTLGKYFASLKVKHSSTSFSEMGQRESVKILYFLPYGVGLVCMMISLICYVTKGFFLHDIIGRNEVIFCGRT